MTEECTKGNVANDSLDSAVSEPDTKKRKIEAEEAIIDDPGKTEIADSPSIQPSRRMKLSKEEREAEKQKKLQIKRQREEEREKAKAKKERIAEEKRQEKEKKEKERAEKKKEEERRKEEKRKVEQERKEAKRREEEEKQRKREEKALKKKEEEEWFEVKKREEEAKKEKKMKQSARFFGFLTKVKKESTEEETVFKPMEKLWYKPFVAKSGAECAPIHRKATLPADYDLLLQHDDVDKTTYLFSDAVKKRTLVTARINQIKFKLFQFHDNYRPPYFGMWKKKDKKVNPRKPCKPTSDTIEYDVDSGAEWEPEPSDAEECRSDEEDLDEQDSDVGEFMVEHGYLSYGEGQDDSEESTEKDAEIRAARLAARASEWKRNVLNKSKILIPNCVGPTLEPLPSLLAYPVFILP